MKKLLTLTVAAVAAALNVNAKTLALWPIDHDGTTFDGRNAVSSANGLSLVTGSPTAGLNWVLLVPLVMLFSTAQATAFS